MTEPDAVSRITLLSRRPDIDAARFGAHWSGPHADIARGLPGIIRYRQHHVGACIHGAMPEVSEVDGVVEMVYSGPGALRAAQGTEIARHLVPRDEPEFLSAWTSHEARQGFPIPPDPDPVDRSFVVILHDAAPALLFDLCLLCRKLGGAIYEVVQAHRREHIRNHAIPARAFAFLPAGAGGDALLETIHRIAPAATVYRARVVDII